MKRLILTILFVSLLVSPATAFDRCFEWDGVNEPIDGYRLYSSPTEGGPYTPVVGFEAIDPALNTVTLTGLTEYLYYVLTAFNAMGESAYSNEIYSGMPPPSPGGLRGCIKP